MIILKTHSQIQALRDAGRIAAIAREAGGEQCREGVTTAHIDAVIRKTILSHGATPSFLHLYGFPGSACISVNDEVIHGIPGGRVLKNGDIVKIDVGAKFRGYHGDCAATFAVGKVSEEAEKLIRVTRESFFKAIEALEKPNPRTGDVGFAVQSHCEANGFSVVRDYVGHGVGTEVHEDPEVPNYGQPGHGVRITKGMVIAIEPMVNAGTHLVRTLEDDWTVVTKDGKLSSHYENTVALTENGVLILTDPA